MKRLTFALTLVVLMAGSVLAQRSVATTVEPVFSQPSSLSIPKITGIESSPGTLDDNGLNIWGKTVTLMSDDASLNLSLDYFVNRQMEEVQDVTKVIGGSWSLIQRNGKVNGMLFGTVNGGGGIEWHYDSLGAPMFAVIQVQLTITGGTDGFVKVGGPQTQGTFTGTVSYAQGGVPEITGSFDLMF